MPSRIARLAAVLLLVLGGAARAATIQFWTPFTSSDGQAIEAMVKDFNATAGKQAGVAVELLIIPREQYYTKLSVALASRRAPELAISHTYNLPAFVKQGALEPFTDAELAQAGLDGGDYLDALWQTGVQSGKRYAVPLDLWPRALYVNRKLFARAGLDPEAPPRTWEELRAAARRIRALGPDIYGVSFRLNGAWTARDFYSLYWQYNDQLLSPDNRDVAPGFAAAATQALQAMKALLDDDLAVRQDTPRYETLFMQDRVGMAFSQINDLLLFSETQGVEFAVVPFPQAGPKPAAFASSHNFVIPRGTAAAMRQANLVFVKWFSEHSLEWVAGGKLPARKSVMDSPAFRAMPVQYELARHADTVRYPPTIVQQPEVDLAVQGACEALYGGRTTVPQAVEAMAVGIRKALAR